MNAILLRTVTIILCLVLIGLLQNKIEAVEDNNDTTKLLYVPDIRVLHGLMLGDDAVAADLLWLRSIFYIASYHDHDAHDSEENHTRHEHEHEHDTHEHKDDSDQSNGEMDFLKNASVQNLLFSNEHSSEAMHLSKLLNMVTDLDSLFVTPFFEGALTLGLVFGRYDEALELLNKGIIALPDSWEMYYYSGFIKLFYLNDMNGSSDDMINAAMKPNVPPIVVQQAAAIKVGLGQREMVIEFLKTLYETTENGDLKEKIENMLAVYDLGMPKAPIDKKDIGDSLDSMLNNL